jgi:hypothetical protein
MPKATVSQEVVHQDLKTLEGGFVDLKQLSFDQILERRDKALRMSMESENPKQADRKVIFESAMQWSRFFEFSNCIVDHNLEDDAGRKMNFSNPMTLRILDPKVGAEIEKLIEQMNQDEEDQSFEDFSRSLASSSTNDQNTQETSTEQT